MQDFIRKGAHTFIYARTLEKGSASLPLTPLPLAFPTAFLSPLINLKYLNNVLTHFNQVISNYTNVI